MTTGDYMDENKDAWIGDRLIRITIADLEIKNISLNSFPTNGKKLQIRADGEDNPKFQMIDECWVKQGTDSIYKSKGLWVYFEDERSRKLSPTCNVAKLLVFNKVKTLTELIGKEVEGVLKSNGFLALLLDTYDEEATYK